MLKAQLKNHGIDLEAIQRAPAPEMPAFNVALYVCRDINSGEIRAVTIPNTKMYFEGLVEVVDHVIVLVHKDVLPKLNG